MPANPPENFPRIAPILFYDNLAAALDWLTKAFGFEVRMSIPGPDGAIMHAELQVADSVIMMGPSGEDAQSSPKLLNGKVTQSIYVYVDHIDDHCSHAEGAGGKILSAPEDQFWGDRNYTVEDLEGHRWTFAEHVRDVAPEDMKPPS